ncbi:FecR family protein [Sphingobacterium sp. MYb382]|uniref:FecR family protein n=1 Tax=Sphingobacterium sp. MYb382 TaxID=2745278 RepID=UPI0030A2B6B6
MNKIDIQYLLRKYLENSLSTKEKREFASHLNSVSDKELVDILSEMEFSADFSVGISDLIIKHRTDKIFENLLLDERLNNFPKVVKVNKARFNRSLWIGIAATFLLFMGVFFYIRYSDSTVTMAVNLAKDIDPAQSMAMIVLENGDKIHVDSTTSGLVYSKAGLEVFINKEGEVVYKDATNNELTPQYLTVNTPKGGHTKLKLSDGTVIELSAASSIRYPMSFARDKREIYVEGQAFFKVSHDESRPFIVHSKKQDIEVLGTTFSLTSTAEFAKTFLVEGSVRIVSEKGSYVLKPGQQATVVDTMDIRYLRPEVIKSWNNEKFVFDNSSFKEILREVENWYNVKMVFYDANFVNIELSGTVSRNVQLSELLKVFEINTGYKFEIEGRRVLVKRY